MPDDAIFCSHCGTRLIADEPQQPEEPAFEQAEPVAAEPVAPAEPKTAADAATVKLACLGIEDILEEAALEEAQEAEVPETGGEAFASEPAEEEAEAEAPEAAEETDAAEDEVTAEEPDTEEAAEPTDVETAETIIEYIQEEAPAEEAGVAEADESTFNAFLAYEICDEMDIDACVVTVTEADGTERSYNEVVLDGELYTLDATEEGGVLEKFIPEEIN